MCFPSGSVHQPAAPPKVQDHAFHVVAGLFSPPTLRRLIACPTPVDTFLQLPAQPAVELLKSLLGWPTNRREARLGFAGGQGGFGGGHGVPLGSATFCGFVYRAAIAFRLLAAVVR